MLHGTFGASHILCFSLDSLHDVEEILQMAAFNIQEALLWKEKIELVIDLVVFKFSLLLFQH